MLGSKTGRVEFIFIFVFSSFLIQFCRISKQTNKQKKNWKFFYFSILVSNKGGGQKKCNLVFDRPTDRPVRWWWYWWDDSIGREKYRIIIIPGKNIFTFSRCFDFCIFFLYNKIPKNSMKTGGGKFSGKTKNPKFRKTK